MVVPPPPGRSNMSRVGRPTEKKLLKVLFSSNLNPRADPSIAGIRETPDGRRSAYSRLFKAPIGSSGWESSCSRSSPAIDRFDSLLLVGPSRGDEAGRGGSTSSQVGSRVESIYRADIRQHEGVDSATSFASKIASHLESGCSPRIPGFPEASKRTWSQSLYWCTYLEPKPRPTVPRDTCSTGREEYPDSWRVESVSGATASRSVAGILSS